MNSYTKPCYSQLWPALILSHAAVVSLSLGGGAACVVGLNMLLLSRQLGQAFTTDEQVLQVNDGLLFCTSKPLHAKLADFFSLEFLTVVGNNVSVSASLKQNTCT